MFWLKSRSFVAIFVFLSVQVLYGHAFNCEDHLVFRLYTPDRAYSDLNRVHYSELKASDPASITSSTFNPKWPTRVFIHGFNSWEKLVAEFRDAYMKIGNYNFIIVDWLIGSITFNYLAAKGRIRCIGKNLAHLLDTLEANHGLDLKDVTIIGHSLGAHTAGLTGKQLKSQNKIGCIVGLDPAGVGFSYNSPKDRLDKEDAEYVQVIHTDIDKFGIKEAIGHADFYPNSGKHQPGCPKLNFIKIWMDDCSHGRANDYFLQSLNETVKFDSAHCESIDQILEGFCRCNNEFELMGGDVSRTSRKPKGVFYLETKPDPPYYYISPLSYRKIRITPKYQ